MWSSDLPKLCGGYVVYGAVVYVDVEAQAADLLKDNGKADAPRALWER